MSERLIFKTPFEFTATTTSTMHIPANTKRTYFLLVNKGNQTVRIKPDNAISGSEGIPIEAGSNYAPQHIPLNGFHVIANSGSQACVFLEADGS